MAGYRKNSNDGPSAEDKALDLFAEMMIERIETISKDWTKPWITEGSLGWPKNLSGREYNGMNALMLLLHCENEGYKIPRFCTFDCVQRMNKPSEKQAKEGVELPRVSVNKGEKSFPVMLTTFTCIHKETKEKIKYDDFKKLSDEEKKMYNVYPKMQVFRVFNVAQTNLQEARPELWNKLANGDAVKLDESEKMSFEPMDVMIRDNRWICPIKPMHQDKAYFSISKNEIVVPEKSQFKDGESYYGTLWHEMTHSTGIEGQLDRIKPSGFGSDEYAREELVAELGSALVAQRYGMSKALKEESCAYLKSWLDHLKESPQFIKTTLLDVKRATSLVTQNVDKIVQELEQKSKVQQDNGQRNEVKQSVPEGKVFYSSVAYLQSTDDTSRLDALREKGDYEGLLRLAKEYYDGDSRLRHGQPALRGRSPAPRRRRIHRHRRSGDAAPSRAGDPAGRGRSVVGNGQTSGKGARHARSRADLPRAGHLHRDAAALPVERGGRRRLSGHLSHRRGAASRPYGRRAAQSPPHGLGHRRHAARAALRGNRRADLRLLCPLLRAAALRRRDRRDRLRHAVQRGTRTRQLLRHAVPPRKERGGGQPDSTQLPNTEMR